MYDHRPRPGADAATAWADLIGAARGIVAGEADMIANMANLAALAWEMLPDLNWAGFYRVIDGGLVLGPFQGRPACIRIALGQGVCGVAAATGETQCVANVHAFPGHIACDAVTAAELVAPVLVAGVAVAVLDLDSPVAGRFAAADVAGAERLCALLAATLS